MSGRTRSGAVFSTASRAPPCLPATAISCHVKIRPLFDAAAQRALDRLQQQLDENEGVPLTTAPLAPMGEADLEPRIVHSRAFLPPSALNTPLAPDASKSLPNEFRSLESHPQQGPSATQLPQPDFGPSEGPTGAVSQKRNKDASKRRRHAKRSARAQSAVPAAYKHSKLAAVRQDHTIGRIRTQTTLKDMPHSRSGSWVGLRTKDNFEDLPEDVETLVKEHGWELVEWDGSGVKVFTDEAGIVFAVLAGRPMSPEWDVVCESVTLALSETARIGLETGGFTLDDLNHRRGCSFFALPVGTSYGGGQEVPGNLLHPKPRERLAQSLLMNQDVRRLAGFQSSVFATYTPKMYAHYGDVMTKIYKHHPHLFHNFDTSVYPAISFNCGPESVSLPHFDYGNLAFGQCAITPFGKYDYRRSGHLKLFNIKKAVQFPPTCTALIPSAFLSHGNGPLQSGETRYSVTQYASGGLFRWVAYGFRSGVSLASTKAGKAKRDEINGEEDTRWLQGLNLFSKYDELFPTLTQP